MDHSQIFEEYINKKIDKVEKFFKHEQGPVDIEATIEIHPVKHYYIAEFRIQSRLYNILARAEALDVYVAIDEAGHKMIAEVSRAKEKLVDKEHHQPKMK